MPNIKTHHLRFWLMGVAFSMVLSCAEKPNSSSATSDPAPRTLSQRINEQTGYVQDANGQWKPRVNRRSSFESKGAASFANQQFSTKNFQTKTIDKQSWWGNRTIDRKRFDASSATKLVPQESMTFNRPHEASQNYATTSTVENGRRFATGSAAEQGTRAIEKTTNSAVQHRRDVFSQPEIIDWTPQRQLDINSTKSMLGR